jgi:hypothetical protein
MFAGVLLQGVEERWQILECRITNDILHASPELSDSETQQRNITHNPILFLYLEK